MAYSIDFRKKVLSYCERTGSITEASSNYHPLCAQSYGLHSKKRTTPTMNKTQKK
ncbi:transposase [Streptococcus pneumoniae]|uniref:transposase n=1 Tax=Streptococcus pneumoniae TaxID=1313 RepID=UPI001CD6467B